MKILLVEDEERIANFINRGLKEQGYAVDVANDGQNALYLVDINVYDMLILDVMLPDVDGLSVCRDIRRKSIQTPILILTALTQVNDRVKGLDAGADDYLGKPFAFQELLARVRALLRREAVLKGNVLSIADLRLDCLSHSVQRAGRIIPLTSKEYGILEFLLRHQGQLVTRTMLSEHVWDEEFVSMSNVIDVHMRYLRRKVDEGFSSKLIHTVRGRGYILKEVALAPAVRKVSRPRFDL